MTAFLTLENACLSPYSSKVFRCLPSPNLKGPGCVIGGFNYERTMSSRSQVKFLFLGGPEFDLDNSWRVYGF